MLKNGLDCSEPTYLKLLGTSWIVLSIWLFVFVWAHGQILAFIPAVYLILVTLTNNPDITVFDDGIETNHFGIKTFIEWKQIYRIEHHGLGCRIFNRKTPLIIRLFYYSIELSKWRNNYKEAIKIIEENINV